MGKDNIILFSLENCAKCEATKQYLREHNVSAEIVQLSHSFLSWSDEQKELLEKYNVLDELNRTAPVLLAGTKKLVGQLRIMNWVDNSEPL